MVDAARVRRKLPSLLTDNPKLTMNNCSSRNKKGWAVYMRYRYRLEQFQKKNPEKYDTLTNKIIAVLSEFEKAVSN
jgi:hypothetical protein